MNNPGPHRAAIATSILSAIVAEVRRMPRLMSMGSFVADPAAALRGVVADNMPHVDEMRAVLLAVAVLGEREGAAELDDEALFVVRAARRLIRRSTLHPADRLRAQREPFVHWRELALPLPLCGASKEGEVGGMVHTVRASTEVSCPSCLVFVRLLER